MEVRNNYKVYKIIWDPVFSFKIQITYCYVVYKVCFVENKKTFDWRVLDHSYLFKSHRERKAMS
jgi:hypothetical protein